MAAPGQLILPRWQLLLKWAAQQRIRVGPGLRVSRTADGIIITIPRRSTWPHPYRVAAHDRAARVSPGLLDMRRPLLDGRYLDGLGADGRTPDPEGRPSLTLDPPAAEVSWIILRRSSDPISAPQIEHVHELDVESVQPLAVLYWDEDRTRVVRTLQVVRHHLSSSASAARAFYWAV
jgi:hypothetical protein